MISEGKGECASTATVAVRRRPSRACRQTGGQVRAVLCCVVVVIVAVVVVAAVVCAFARKRVPFISLSFTCWLAVKSAQDHSPKMPPRLPRGECIHIQEICTHDHKKPNVIEPEQDHRHHHHLHLHNRGQVPMKSLNSCRARSVNPLASLLSIRSQTNGVKIINSLSSFSSCSQTQTILQTHTRTTIATRSSTLNAQQRSRIHFLLFTAFAYILSPIDLIPELIFGVFGIIDDLLFLFLCLFGVAIIVMFPLFRQLRQTMQEKLGPWQSLNSSIVQQAQHKVLSKEIGICNRAQAVDDEHSRCQ